VGRITSATGTTQEGMHSVNKKPDGLKAGRVTHRLGKGEHGSGKKNVVSGLPERPEKGGDWLARKKEGKKKVQAQRRRENKSTQGDFGEWPEQNPAINSPLS